MNYSRKGRWVDARRFRLRQDRPIQDRQLSVRQIWTSIAEKTALKMVRMGSKF